MKRRYSRQFAATPRGVRGKPNDNAGVFDLDFSARRSYFDFIISKISIDEAGVTIEVPRRNYAAYGANAGFVIPATV